MVTEDIFDRMIPLYFARAWIFLILLLTEAAYARIIFDRSLYKNSKYYSRGLLTITQSDTPDSIFFNPANLELTSRKYIEGLSAESESFYLAGQKTIDCVEKTGFSSFSKKSKIQLIKICLDHHEGELVTAIKEILPRKKYKYIRSCLKAKSDNISLSQQCYSKIVKTISYLDSYQKNVFYIANVDSSKFGIDLLQEDTEEEKTQYAIENRGDSATFYAGHSLIYYNDSYAIGLLQNLNLAAIASFDEIEDIESQNAGLLSLNADYSKTNGLIVSSGGAVSKNFNIGANFKIINRHRSQYVANITDLEKIKNIKSLKNTQDGTGLGIDIGVTYIKNSLCLAGVVENISDLHLKKAVYKGNKIETIPQVEKVGASYKFKYKSLRLEVGVEAEDLNNNNDLSLGSRVRLGSSACMDWTLCLNTGILDGYFSAGISSDSYSKFKYSISVYTRDLSSEIGLRPETHYAIQLGAYL